MRNSSQPVMLITDDDRSFRETMAEVFERRGFAPILAASGEEAIQVTQKTTVHVALFDFHMPQRTGLESITACRSMGVNIPYILLTGALDQTIATQAESIEIFSLLEKPVSIQIVTGVVKEAMSRHYPWYELER
ncbi:response regulator [Bremerella sp. JC817]|uniref:response regulator n=1 Tax=Bremerella sp. JC817 TaxID=3231756 RepID=UPI00345A9748